MSYNTKYYANFYSKNGTNGTIYFKKKDYTGNIIKVKLDQDGLEFNSRLDNWMGTYVIPQNLSISIMNDFTDWYTLIDLMEVGEKDFQVLVNITDKNSNSITLFNGWLNSESIEQRYLNNSIIRLTASNYVSKLNTIWPDIVNDNQIKSLIDIINNTLKLTGFDRDIYVNNSLWPNNYTYDASRGTFNVAGISTETFWKNSHERDYGTDILDKILKPFDSYLYYWDEKWYIERFGDIYNGDTKTYLRYDNDYSYEFTDDVSIIQINEPSLNICDLTITDRTQMIKMDPGLNEMNIKTKPKAYINLLPPDFHSGTEWNTTTTKSFLDPKERGFDVHYYTDPSIGDILTYHSNRGEEWRDIKNYFHQNLYGTDDQLELDNGYDNTFLHYFGFSTRINVSIPTTGDESYTLKITWKWNPNATGSNRYWSHANRFNKGYKLYWWLMDTTAGVGPLSNYYIKFDEENKIWYKTDYGYTWEHGPNVIEVPTDAVDQNSGTYTANIEIPLKDVSVCSGAPGFSGYRYLTFGIGRSTYHYDGPSLDYEGYVKNNKIGDIGISIDTKYDEKILKGKLDNNFLNKKDVKLDIFDAYDWTASNALKTASDWGTLTNEWKEHNETEHYSLAQHILVERMKTYNKNRKTFSATFIYPYFLKPFRLFNDPSSGAKYLLTSYSYNPMKDIYKASFMEYDNEETINIIET